MILRSIPDHNTHSNAHLTQGHASGYYKASLILLPCIGGLLVPVTSASAQVVSADDGTGTVVNAVGDRIDITGGQTSSDNANLFQSFEQFDLDVEQTANFIAAPEITNVVGRVSGDQASVINGTLQVSGSDANLYLMNPAGVLIGPDAQLNLSGGFTATTATDIDFENHTFEFATDRPGAIVNFAELEVERGESINLVGGTVVNAGNLTAPEGSITVAAVEGNSVVRISQGDQLLSLEVDANKATSSTITAESIGEMLTGEGLDHANTLVTHVDGSVSLGHAETVIDETGGSAIATSTLSTVGETGGNINVLGEQVSLIDAHLDASGASGGGLIRVGGDYQGNGRVFNARQTTVDETTTIAANATEQGNGGTAIVWADDTTSFAGKVEARGGEQSGDGGFAEISGANLLSFSGTADLSATAGTMGRVLLDPQNWVITDGAAPANTGTTSYISSSTIENWTGASYDLLASNSIRLEDLSDNELKLQTGVSLSLTAENGSVVMEDAVNDTIFAEQGDVSISGAGLFLGGINTGTDEHDPGGNGTVTAGDVTLTSSQNVDVREIIASGLLNGTTHHSPNGGDVIVTAANGDIDIANAITTSSYVNGRESGSAGDITLRTDNGSITVGTNSPPADVLQATSLAVSHTSSNGGNISVVANNGDILIDGYISSISAANQSDSYNNSNAGDAGDVTITASGTITTDRIFTTSTARGDMPDVDGHKAGAGGDVTIESTGSEVNTGRIQTFSSAEGDTSSAGGNVVILAATGASVDSIDASSRADRYSGNGGNITIEAPNNVSVAGEIESYSYTRKADDTGDAGTVNILSNNIQTGLIEAWSVAQDDRSGRGGDVILSDSGPGNNSTINIASGIQTFSQADDEDANGGGSVTIMADSVTLGMISGNSVDTTSTADENATDGGVVTIEARENLTVSGRIRTFSEARDKNAGNGGNVVLSGNNVSLDLIDTRSRADENEGSAGNVTVNSVQSLSLQGIDATSDASDGNILLVSDRIEDLGTLAGGTLTIDSATAPGNISIGGTTRTTGFSLLESDLTALEIDDLLIGRAGSEDTITLQRSLLTSVGSRPSIMIRGGSLLKGPDGTDNTFQITDLGEGALLNADVTFANIENLHGGNQNDTFQFINNGAIATKIDGQAGYDTFDYSNSSNLPVRIDLANMTATNVGEFGSIERVQAGTGSNNTIQGGSENNIWQLTGSNQGILNENEATEIAFENFQNLIGGSQDDSFSIATGGSITGMLDGNGGTNELDYRQYNSAITVDLETLSASGVDSFSDIVSVIGNDNVNNRITGTVNNDIFTLTGERSGSVDSSRGELLFSNISVLNGERGENTFNLENLTENSNIRIEGGTDLDNSQSNNRIVTASNNALWSIEFKNQGTIDSNGEQLVRFREIQHLENTAAEGTTTALFERSSAQVTGSLNSGGSDLELIGEDINIGHGIGMDLQNGRVTGQGELTIRTPSNNTAIELGGVDQGAPNQLNITAGELAALQDGFERITIGGEEHTGDITLAGDAAFKDTVELRSQGNINLTSGNLSTTDSDIQIHSQGEVETDGISTTGGNINISAADGISITGNISTSQTNPSIPAANSGSVEISSERGGITTAGITTAATEATTESGSVTLTSPASIEIEFINARGNYSNTEQPVVSIDTRDSFTMTGSNATGNESITTVGAPGGSIQIIYGEEGESATNFLLSRAGDISTDNSTIEAGSTSNNLKLADLSFINRGIQPIPPEPEVPEPDPEPVFGPLELILAEAPVEIALEESHNLFARLESAIGSEFSQYFNLTEETQPPTLAGAQDTLKSIKFETGIQPGLVYIYFVPDAEYEAAIVHSGPRVARPDDQLEVMLVSERGEPVRQRQWGVTRAQVEEQAQALRAQVNNEFSTRNQYLAPAQQLYDWMIEPIAQDLDHQNIDSIGFILDTGLRTLPLATLHNGDNYLVEDYSIGLMPTFSLTNFERNEVERGEFRNANVLAMGASEFDQQPDLPAVSAELQLLAEGVWQSDAFLNEEFVLENLQTQLQETDYGVVHLATHATFESGNLNDSYIQFWKEQLSLDDIDTLNLSDAQVRLIVLSACRTALGDVASEYGFAGFAVNSGSPSALASLWSVSDEGTLGFMAQFYDHLRESPGRSNALRDAQLDMLSGKVRISDGAVYGPDDTVITEIPALAVSGSWDFSHPFYWSAFTMIGNPW